MDSWEIKSGNIFDRRYLNFVKRWWLDIDKVNFLLVLGIIIFGLIMTTSSSPAIARKLEVEKFFFLKKQMIFAFLSVSLLIFISFLDREKIKLLSIAGVLGAVFLLVLVLVFGSEAKGAKRWISLLGFTIQPSEFAKTFFIVFNALILHRFSDKNFFLKYGLSSIVFLTIISLLIMQPDFGMTLTFTVLWAVQLFLYGMSLPIVYGLAIVGVIGGIGAYVALPHVEDRINRFLDAGAANYQVERSIDAFINGSFFGTGPGNGVVKRFIPDAHTDFVFAVVSEEFGIISCIAILISFGYLITRITKRALDEENMFIYLSLCGLMTQFTMQVIVNTGVSLGLLPTKGMTLPFISYGGSSMVSMGLCFGLILAFTKKKYHLDVDYGNVKMI